MAGSGFFWRNLGMVPNRMCILNFFFMLLIIFMIGQNIMISCLFLRHRSHLIIHQSYLHFNFHFEILRNIWNKSWYNNGKQYSIVKDSSVDWGVDCSKSAHNQGFLVFFAYLVIFWYVWEKIRRYHFWYFEYLNTNIFTKPLMITGPFWTFSFQ